MSLYLVRYGELGLKSPQVKKRFQKALKLNIEDAFLKEDVQCITSWDWGRIYLHTDEDGKAEDILSKIFGITSFSRVIETSSEISEICKTAAEFSKDTIHPGSSFAVRARRTGNHQFTSQDVAKEAGSAILAANENINVNLTQPDIEIFVEVRHNKAFIFNEKIQGPGGFPVGTQGRALALITDRKSVYAAWLIMKRGCTMKLLCVGEEPLSMAGTLKSWYLASRPRKVEDKDNVLDEALDLAKKDRSEALVLGRTFAEFEKESKIQADIPVFYPLIGMSDNEIERGIISLFGDGS
jgi:thiamine biosynthesis protein ThiI